MTSPFEDRVALVTGGGRGISRAVAVGLAAAGARVAVAARTGSEVDAVVASIANRGGAALAVPVDLGRRAKPTWPCGACAGCSAKLRSSSTMPPS